ncbi:unnamed protein product [Candidula unifasciata]|uniref:TNFR-Cys domain-containing protein n=1 Tax=Candidula unifasciata TaxID=100452 RepID=A0A8S3ZRF4_9EUPU|nr:unnamed protein product [Candidula unifasciata]
MFPKGPTMYLMLVAEILQYLILSKSLACVIRCDPGERLHTPAKPEGGDVCIPCDPGSFMSETDHTNRECNFCSKTNSSLELVFTECNRTRDTEIRCVDGYYRKKAETVQDKDTCEVCRKCESGLPARPCQGYNDTFCCPFHHDAVLGCQGKYECKKRPPPCGAGMYYDTTLERCMSCPDGTYMQAQSHRNTECVKCEALSDNSTNHAAILQPCSSTSPTVFGCEELYFRSHNTTSLLEEAQCTLCKKCRREVRTCQLLHDDVCAEESPDDDNTSEERTGTTNDAENSAEGKMLFNGTLGSGERNQSPNATTEPPNCEPFDVTLVTCTTLIIILMSTFYLFISTTKPEQLFKRSHGQTAWNVLRNHQTLVFDAIWVMLLASLIVCIFCTIEPIMMSNTFNKVFVTMTVIATGVFISAVIYGHACCCRQTDQSRDNKESRHPAPGDDDHYLAERCLKGTQSDNEEQAEGEEEAEKLNRY